MKLYSTTAVLAMMLLTLTTGCQRPSQGSGSGASGAGGPSTTGLSKEKHVLAAEPAGAKHVFALREQASQVKDGEEIVVVGRIGGSKKPFTGRASFTIVDASLKPCNELEGDTCEEPWDYCCDTDRLPSGIATVKIVDVDGATIGMDAKKDLALLELQTIVVKGKAKRDEAGNLTVLAPAVFVRK